MKLASLEAIVRTLNDAEVRYLVVGGLAVAAHGYGRVTFDVDLVVQLRPDNIMRAVKALQTLGYKPLVPERIEGFADTATRERWIREKGLVVFQLYSEQHRETLIDLFVTEAFDFESEYAQAKRSELSPGLQVPFVTCGSCGWSRSESRMAKPEIPELKVAADPWLEHNLSQLRYFRSLTLREKMHAVEGMADVVRRLEGIRKSEKPRQRS